MTDNKNNGKDECRMFICPRKIYSHAEVRQILPLTSWM